MTDETQGAAEAVTEDLPDAAVDQIVNEATGGQPGDDAAAAADTEGEGEQPKPKKSAQERINELTAKARQAERDAQAKAEEADYWKQEALRGRQPEPKPDTGDARPSPSDYEGGVYDEAYLEALTDWKAEQAAKRLFDERDQKTAAERAAETWREREAAVRQQHPDYDEVVWEGAKRRAWVCTDTMNQALGDSEVGPQVAYHLASNPDEARRIAALAPVSQVREIGRLEAMLTAAPKPAAKTITTAPEPTPQVRGSGGRFELAADTNDFAAFEKAYP